MSLKVCEWKHPQICYTDDKCPCCELLEMLKEKEDRIKRMRESLNRP